MRKKLTAVLAALAFTMVGAGLFTPADAGGGPNTFTVVKVVEGPVPAGAVFEVQVDCVQDNNNIEGGAQATFEFDENGDPIGPDVLSVGLYTECTAVETVTNGATVTYACEVATPISVSSEGAGFTPVECVDDQTVYYDEVFGAEGTITVTNTFEETPQPPDVDVDVDVDDVVAATPTFTG